MARKKQNRFTQVIVATSDQAEQWTIFSAGALRIPARELLGDMQRAKKEVDVEARKLTDQSQVIRHSPWDPKQLLELEKLRDHLTNDQ